MIIESIRRNVLNSELKNQAIRGLWGVDCLFQPKPQERIFNCNFVVAQSCGQGSAYGTDKIFDREILCKYIGKSYGELAFDDFAVEIAVLDSLFGSMQKEFPPEEVAVSGESKDKLRVRSEIIYNEAMRLLNNRTDIKVVNVGVVGDILKVFADNGINVVGTDFDSAIVETEMFDTVHIYSGNKTLDLVRTADVAIVTGMALATGTIDDILEVAAAHNTKIIMFAETGSNFSDIYLNNGVDVFVSEPFPFYIFNGETKFIIYRR